ncbi:hypothetical protein EST38_g9441 [Candolleomyces aberdarensis]|uniref:Uncharacterized protein n=1 Tax=Candolleomyces aberdarensis TaxID=2316362 RepID=A0A4Q2DBM6_9AGAR|nr:hypothetical protein EST38_g9441 [Candolleomyces aberdarensis]
MFKRFPDIQKEQWDVSLYTPPTSVSTQEHDQIARKLDEWAEALAKSSFELPELPHPLRPFWITPATSSLPKFDANPGSRTCLPIVCVSASKQVQDGSERRSSGFSYIQGSGDDHELWGMGLTPQLFWQHKDTLLTTNRSGLPDLVSSLVSSHTSSSSTRSTRAPEGIAKIADRISITSLSEIDPAQLATPPPLTAFVLIDEVAATTSSDTDPLSPLQVQDGEGLSTNQLSLACTPSPSVPTQILKFEILGGKKSQTYFLHSVLPTSLHFIGTRLSQSFNIIVACPSAKDLSVGVALGAISQFFDDRGMYIEGGAVNQNSSTPGLYVEGTTQYFPGLNVVWGIATPAKESSYAPDVAIWPAVGVAEADDDEAAG